jgi:hypothetical protein
VGWCVCVWEEGASGPPKRARDCKSRLCPAALQVTSVPRRCLRPVADVGESSHQEYARKTYQAGSGRRADELKFSLQRNIRVSIAKIGVRNTGLPFSWGGGVQLEVQQRV